MKLNERPTPETEAVAFMPSMMPPMWNMAQKCVQAKVSIRLEQQRDALAEIVMNEFGIKTKDELFKALEEGML